MQDLIIYASVAYFCAISVISAVITCHDKRQAIKGKRRVPEKTLITLAVLGGAVFEYLTMITIRHKTKHAKFMVGLPFIIFVQLVLTVVICTKI